MREAPPDAALDVGAYCREVEAFLCRRNGGHIIRLVGPAFSLVSGWASQGVPVRVVLQGIEQTVARAEARGAANAPRRRPVRIEFCEADVLTAFDQWRRAVGPSVSRAATSTVTADTGDSGERASAKRQPSLTRHLERVIERLSSLRASTSLPAESGLALDAALSDLDDVRVRAHGARGEARQALHDQLGRIDEQLMASLLVALMDGPSGAKRDSLRALAETDLRPLRPRLSDDAYADATRRVLRHLVRVDLGIPDIVLP